jgi:membrane protease YdiL (CAAX protease family)
MNEAQESTNISSRDKLIIKPFLMFAFWAGLFYILYTGDLYIASLIAITIVFLWIALVDEPKDFIKPLRAFSEPSKETVVAFLPFVYWSIFLFRDFQHLGYTAILCCTMAFGFVVPLTILVARGNSIQSLGLRFPEISDLAFPLMLCFTLILGGFIRIVFSGPVTFDPSLPQMILPDILLLGCVIPFVEEFVFRCVMQNRISLVLESRVGGLLLTSSLFAALHIATAAIELGFTGGGLLLPMAYALITRLPLGLLIGVIWNKSESIAGPWIVHSVNNLIVIIMESLM